MPDRRCDLQGLQRGVQQGGHGFGRDDAQGHVGEDEHDDRGERNPDDAGDVGAFGLVQGPSYDAGHDQPGQQENRDHGDWFLRREGLHLSVPAITLNGKVSQRSFPAGSS